MTITIDDYNGYNPNCSTVQGIISAIKEAGNYDITRLYGVIDFYPKANKLLIRRKNKWIKPALKFIINRVLEWK